MALCPVNPWVHLPLGTSNSKISAQLLRPSLAPAPSLLGSYPIPPGGGRAHTRVQDLSPPPLAVRQSCGMQDGEMRPGTGADRLGLSHCPLPLRGVSRRSIWPHWHCLIPHPPAFHPGHMAANFALALEMTLNSPAKCHHARVLLECAAVWLWDAGGPWGSQTTCTLASSAQDMRKIIFLHPLCHAVCSHSSLLHLL